MNESCSSLQCSADGGREGSSGTYLKGGGVRSRVRRGAPLAQFAAVLRHGAPSGFSLSLSLCLSIVFCNRLAVAIRVIWFLYE